MCEFSFFCHLATLLLNEKRSFKGDLSLKDSGLSLEPGLVHYNIVYHLMIMLVSADCVCSASFGGGA